MTDSQRDDSSGYRLRFGRHRGQRIADVLDAYIYWAVRRRWVYPETKAELREELRRRARRRRSWRPVVQAIYGRRLLAVIGRGQFAVVQQCGDDQRELTVELYETAEQAQAHRERDCGYEGPEDCQPSRHVAVDLTDWTVLSGQAIASSTLTEKETGRAMMARMTRRY